MYFILHVFEDSTKNLQKTVNHGNEDDSIVVFFISNFPIVFVCMSSFACIYILM